MLHNQDNREHDLLDSDDYYQFQGGMLAAVATFRGEQPACTSAITATRTTPRIRTLQGGTQPRGARPRANPKWIEGMKRHGYKGAFELAATVDYLFAFDATARAGRRPPVRPADRRLPAGPSDTRDFLQQHNPGALRDMFERLLEAQQRGLWQEPGDYQATLENLLLDAEES